MKHRTVYATLILLLFILMSTAGYSSTLKKQVTFEEGSSWSYNKYFDLWSELGALWQVTTSDPQSGTYCAESKPPISPYLANNSAGFHFTVTWAGWGKEVYISYYAKFPANWTDVSDAGRANTIRYGTSAAAGTWTNGGEYATSGWLYPYGDTTRYPAAMYLKDNTWHKYTWYLKYSSSAGAADGVWKEWRDGVLLSSYTNIKMADIYSHILFGQYYKGTTSGNTKWWIDNIEIWDGMPSTTPGDTQAPAAPQGINLTVLQ